MVIYTGYVVLMPAPTQQSQLSSLRDAASAMNICNDYSQTIKNPEYSTEGNDKQRSAKGQAYALIPSQLN